MGSRSQVTGRKFDRRFDVITQVNGQPVTSASDASRKLQAIASGRLARILVLRGGQELGLAIKKE